MPGSNLGFRGRTTRSEARETLLFQLKPIFSLLRYSNRKAWWNMAPVAQQLAPRSPPQPRESVLPGMKRGIAIGVASSVCLILISLVALLVVRRRRQARKRARQQTEDASLPWPPEKNSIYMPHPANDGRVVSLQPPASPLPEEPPQPPVEADTRTIYELDAGIVLELPTKVHTPKAQELHAFEKDNEAKECEALESDSERRRRYRDVPSLHITPPDMVSAPNMSPSGVSPMAVSPLEDAYLAQSPRSPAHWM